MEKMKQYRLLSVFLIALIISSCASWSNKYGKLKIIPKSQKEVTIQDLIEKWDDYNTYYFDPNDGFNVRSPLGIIFDPKNNGTTLVGDRWKKVRDQKTLIQMTKWIYPTTQYEPWLNEILGPDGRFYGYLYYSYGIVVLKLTDDGKMYVYDLEEPAEERSFH
jgi:hypothetical protein